MEQRDFFGIIDELFVQLTGKRYFEFGGIEDFGDEVRKNAQSLARRAVSEWNRAIEPLNAFYRKCGTTTLAGAKQLGGLKLVLGGGSRFSRTQLDSVCRVLLYADTVLIPDPVLPWLETDRSEEQFRHVLMLESIFTLLHLKPLVDASLEYPAVYIFQSWEKSLAQHDPVTRERSKQLVTGVLGTRSGRRFDDFTELRNFALEHAGDFLKSVEEGRLFVGPGGTAGQPVDVALEQYLSNIQTWRSTEYQAKIQGLPKPLVVLLAIMERLDPQYHLMENSDELGSHPFVCIPAQSHYYELCTSFFNDRLRCNSSVSDETVRTINALQLPTLSWLSNVPMDELVELRRNNENETFRKRLQEHVQGLHGASIDDLDRVAAEVSRGISSLIMANKEELARIERKYRRKHLQTSVVAAATLACVLVPTLAPFLGSTLAPVAVAGKYAWDKIEERNEKKDAARSLMGVLARAKTDRRS